MAGYKRSLGKHRQSFGQLISREDLRHETSKPSDSVIVASAKRWFHRGKTKNCRIQASSAICDARGWQPVDIGLGKEKRLCVGDALVVYSADVCAELQRVAAFDFGNVIQPVEDGDIGVNCGRLRRNVVQPTEVHICQILEASTI